MLGGGCHWTNVDIIAYSKDQFEHYTWECSFNHGAVTIRDSRIHKNWKNYFMFWMIRMLIYVQKSFKGPSSDFRRLSESSISFPNSLTSGFASTRQANWMYFIFINLFVFNKSKDMTCRNFMLLIHHGAWCHPT